MTTDDSAPLLTIGLVPGDDHGGLPEAALAVSDDVGAAGLGAAAEILWADGLPGGAGRDRLAARMAGAPTARPVRYAGPAAAAREAAVRGARGAFVLLLDARARLAGGVLARVARFCRGNPSAPDLYHGPLVDPRGTGPDGSAAVVGTHWAETWDEEGRYGVWRVFPPGCRPDAAPFPVALSSCDVLLARRGGWPAPPPGLEDLASEPGFLHGRYRRQDPPRAAVCLPWLRWTHPGGGLPPAPADPGAWAGRARAALLACRETGRPRLAAVARHLRRGDRVPGPAFDALVRELGVGPAPDSAGPASPDVPPPDGRADAATREAVVVREGPGRAAGRRLRVLIGVMTAAVNRHKARAVAETWAAGLPAGFDLVFIVGDNPPGRPGARREGDTLHVDGPDDYPHIGLKAKQFFRWALSHDFDRVMRCDDDTYVAPDRLARLLESASGDYVGRDFGGFASGGAGYLLSRRAVELLAASPEWTGATVDDVQVARELADAGIGLVDERRFEPDHAWPWPAPGNGQVTGHYVTPAQMRLAWNGFHTPVPPADCRLGALHRELVDRARRKTVVALAGAGPGPSTRSLVAEIQRSGRRITLAAAAADGAAYDALAGLVDAWGVGGLVEVIRPGPPAEARFADGALEAAVLGGDPAGIRGAIRAWLPKVAPGGFLAGDDAPDRPEVLRAVLDELPGAVRREAGWLYRKPPD